MTIDLRLATTPTIPLGLEGSIEALVLTLDAASADADEAERLATRERFEAAEDALEHQAEAARRKAVGEVFSGAAQLAGGVVGTIDAARQVPTPDVGGSTSTSPDPAQSQASETPGASSDGPSLGVRLGTGAIDDALGIGATIASISESRATVASGRANLESERAEARANDADERSDRDRTLRESLMRRLDDLLRSEREAEMRIASGGG